MNWSKVRSPYSPSKRINGKNKRKIGKIEDLETVNPDKGKKKKKKKKEEEEGDGETKILQRIYHRK